MSASEDYFIGSPYLLQFNLLKNCINSCDYCYLKGCDNTVFPFKSFKTFLEGFKFYYDSMDLLLTVSLTGGDLFLYPELKQVLSYLSQAEHVQSVSLLLNSLWKNDSKEQILTIKDKLESVQLNIDNIESRISDIKWLTDHGIIPIVKILISNNNEYYKHQIKILKKILSETSELYVSVDRLIPISEEQLKEIVKFETLKKKIDEIKDLCGDKFISDDPIINNLLNSTRDIKNDSLYGCSIGRGSLTVYPSGSIKLCPRIPNFDTGFFVENFAFEEYVKYTANLLNKIRNECKECKNYTFCNSGCFATSFVMENRLSKDVHCSI